MEKLWQLLRMFPGVARLHKAMGVNIMKPAETREEVEV